MFPRDFEKFSATDANIKLHQEAIRDLLLKPNLLLGRESGADCAAEGMRRDGAPDAATVQKLLDDWTSSTSKRGIQCLVRQIFAQFILDQDYGYQQPNVLNGRLIKYFPVSELINYEPSTDTWKSVEGIATLVDLKMRWLKNKPVIKNFAVMKIQQPSSAPQEELIHEIVVGTILNAMRDYLPCFMYVYGGFFCGYPTDANMKALKFATMCDNNSDMHACMLSENVPSPRDFRDFWFDSTINENDKQKVFLLVCFSLAEANSRFGFVHGDLHFGNILIRKAKPAVTLKFNFAGKSLSITTSWIPVIIDFGRSQINWNGKKLTPIYNPAKPPAVKHLDKGKLSYDYLVGTGQAIDGLDLVRLVTSFAFENSAPEVLSPLMHQCFYNMSYDWLWHNPTLNVGKLEGTPANQKKFSDSTLTATKDLNQNGSCPKGFLTELLGVPQYEILCGVTSPEISLYWGWKFFDDKVVIMQNKKVKLIYSSGNLILEDTAGLQKVVQAAPSKSGAFRFENDWTAGTLSLTGSTGVYKSWSYSGYDNVNLVLRDNGVLKIKGTKSAAPTTLVDVAILFTP